MLLNSETGRSLGQNSTWLTAGIIIADVVGAGILSMGVAVKQFGWLAGSFMIVLLFFMNCHISIILWRITRAFPAARTMTELADKASAGSWLHEFSVNATGFSQYAFLCGMLSLYSLSFGKALGMMFYSLRTCLPTWVMSGCLILYPFFATARTLGSWPSLVWLNILTLFGTILIPLCYLASQGVGETRPPNALMVPIAELKFDNVLIGCSTFTFAFTSQFMLVEIIAEMERPREFPKAYLYISGPFQLFAFLAVGLGVYYFKGDSVQGMIADNIPFGMAFQVAAMCLFIHMIITFLIKGVVVGRAIYNYIEPGGGVDEYSTRSNVLWNGIIVSVLVSSFLIAQIIPFFADFVDLLGASLTPLGCYIVPLYIYTIWLSNEASEKDRDGVSMLEKGLIGAEVIFALILMVFGTRAAIANIAAKWSQYGYPFECHCESVWNTCACSGNHAGMEMCPATSSELAFLQQGTLLSLSGLA
jgi:amino acid permease